MQNLYARFRKIKMSKMYTSHRVFKNKNGFVKKYEATDDCIEFTNNPLVFFAMFEKHKIKNYFVSYGKKYSSEEKAKADLGKLTKHN